MIDIIRILLSFLKITNKTTQTFVIGDRKVSFREELKYNAITGCVIFFITILVFLVFIVIALFILLNMVAAPDL